jgi:hypothetical protein
MASILGQQREVRDAHHTDLEGSSLVSVNTTPVKITFSSSLKPRTVIISAANDNPGSLYIGKSDVTTGGANVLTYLDAGEKIILDYDIQTNPLYVVSAGITSSFYKGALY